MRRLFLAAFGVLAVAGVGSAQQPQYQPPAAPAQYQQPARPVQYQQPAAPATYSPGAVAATPIQPTSGATVITGAGCTNCGPAAVRGAFTMSNVTGGNCLYGQGCQNGCGSVKSDLAFHFGTCSQFFSPCGPTCGGLFKKCPTTQFNQPYGIGWQCPRQYDSYANH